MDVNTAIQEAMRQVNIAMILVVISMIFNCVAVAIQAHSMWQDRDRGGGGNG